MSVSVATDLTDVRYGWKLRAEGVGTGRHLGATFQDPALVIPNMSGKQFRTTLIQDGPTWYVMELCEPLKHIDPQAQFHGFVGSREILTIINNHRC